MGARCLLGIHDYLNWRVDANYRFCRRCWRWQHIELDYTAFRWREFETHTWQDCEPPKEG